jgi:hypothetical protein
MTAATAGVEKLDEFGEIGQGTGEAVNLVDDHDIKGTGPISSSEVCFHAKSDAFGGSLISAKH